MENLDPAICKKCNLKNVKGICPVVLALLSELSSNPKKLGKPGEESIPIEHTCPKTEIVLSTYQDGNSVAWATNHNGEKKSLPEWIQLYKLA